MANSRLPGFYPFLSTLLLVIMLGACGGGGGTDDPGFIGGGAEEPEAPTVPGDSTSSNVTSLTIILTDLAGNETNSITSVSPGTLNVTATKSGGQPVPNAIVAANVTLGNLLPASGTALTDLNGQAAFRLEAGTEIGAGTVTASIGTLSQNLNYQIGAANLRIGRLSGATFVEGEIDAGAVFLPAGGSTPLTVAVVDLNDALVTNSVAVIFDSSCASQLPAQADVTSPVNTVNGIATATYTATGCSGSDLASATLVQGNAQSATVTLDIASAGVNAIAFLSADPTLIALKGTGGEGRQESSTVEFQVLDTTGTPVQGADVAFSLSTELGGLSLTNDSATTNIEGVATAIVLAGNVSTAVRVTATIVADGQERSTVSDKLVVSTGLPDQNSLSLSVTTFNPGGGDIDGVNTILTVRMADKFNNPVPNGTAAFFTTEYGVIEDSCETTDGTCSVTWTSQSPRQPLIYNNFNDQDYISTIAKRTCARVIPPAMGVPCYVGTNGDADDSTAVGIGRILGRRSTIMVSTIGEESFVDGNGNGVYDVGESHQDLGEAFLDNNENRPPGNWLVGFDGESLCDPSDLTQAGRDCASGLEETFVDFNVDGIYTAGNGIYNGSLCPEELANLPTPACSRDLLSVRGDLVVVMSSSSPQQVTMLNGIGVQINPQIGVAVPSGKGMASFGVVIADRYNNMPPAGSTVIVSAADGCRVGTPNTFEVPNTSITGAYLARFSLGGQDGNETANIGSVTIELKNFVGASPEPRTYRCFDPAEIP
jgi:hypothetical protein